MTIKIGNKIVGENAEEQFKLERKRFESKQKRSQELNYSKEEALLKLGEGNKKLSDFIQKKQ